ncbi:MarR family transcriptional regulator [Streptomyces sp. XM83C]|jgi:DNA-binding MarR family transcriptional regulator|uniref:MarR family winged helix-turn-helix transcriptional regulator n=1 Tax=Streptomyces thermocoprophilus TaxID=78356 RepID=A0ABV5V712_9ACTN|nr:MarR family transcriptional regulator [Streptomyces sp. XM83C]MCK1819395.1 MarR family transcriptional regulator [Streptomyces sp. XM83C]
MDDEDTLAEDLRQTIGELVRTVRAVDTLPLAEAAVLGHLDRTGPQTTAELAQRRGVTHQSSAKTVKDLRTGGLVRTEPHPTDGRKLLVHITDTGRARLRTARAQRSDRLSVALREELSPAEQQHLRDCVPLLARLTAYLRNH